MAAGCFSKSIFPIRLHLLSDACNKSSVNSFFENAFEKSRQLFRLFFGKNTLSPENFRPQHRLPEYSAESCISAVRPKFALPSIHRLTSKWALNSLASREWARKSIHRGRAPIFCFVGFALAKKPSLLTEEEEHEKVSYMIRDSFSTIPWQDVGLNIDRSCGFNRQFSLADIKIGEMIAKGCNAAVYSACFKDKDLPVPEKAEDVKSEGERSDLLTCSRIIVSHSEGEEEMRPLNSTGKSVKLPSGQFGAYNLAIKVMFNYSAESNAYAIWNAMNKETLPCIGEFSLGDDKVRKKRLKPHPNVVEMYFAFADQIPLLPGACKNFPHALPVRLLSDGCGRNMTLFLMMKRYHCSLKDYLECERPSPRTCLLLFTQLLEALVHLYESEIAHRDLKTDNILLDLSDGPFYPKLAVTDFGCCLESLSLNYPSQEISKGGNVALMAPEVVGAECGPFSQIDYSRADLWTAGTIAYEIFGDSNPFSSSKYTLKSHSYRPEKLPPLPTSAPAAVQRLVKEMLRRDPKQRPSPSFAATVCQILLHAGCWDTNKTVPGKALEWMFLMSARTFLEGSLTKNTPRPVEFELRHTLCSRVQYLELTNAIKYISEC